VRGVLYSFCSKHSPDSVAESRIENSSGGGFDLLWAGTNATNVSKEATLVAGSGRDTGIVLSDATQWTHGSSGPDLARYKRGWLDTTKAGASFSFTFNGTQYGTTAYIIPCDMLINVSRRHYGSLGPSNGFFAVSIDGSAPQRLDGKSVVQLYERVLWSRTGLSPGRHTVTLTVQDDTNGTYVDLDFFRSVTSEVRQGMCDI
jgi:hypothetical protein